jgi:GTP-binding protein EngB required for normal cell division
MDQCSNPQCQVSTTKTCLEGFDDLSDCSSYNGDINTDFISEKDEVVDFDAHYPEEPKGILLPGKDRLSVIEASDMIADHGGSIVALIGQANVGKTTLVASLYQLLQSGAIGDWKFAGSKSLFPLERLCHSSRYHSNRRTPDTPRTSVMEGLSFYHLSLYDNQVNTTNIFLADRAGEAYKNAIDSTESCLQLLEVKCSTVIVLLVNGENLASNVQRHSERFNATSMLDALKEANIVRIGTNLLITLTKLDLIQEDEQEKVEKELVRIKDHASKLFEQKLKISTLQIAARPETQGSIKQGHGLDCMLDKVINHKPKKVDIDIPCPKSNRMIDNYKP